MTRKGRRAREERVKKGLDNQRTKNRPNVGNFFNIFLYYQLPNLYNQEENHNIREYNNDNDNDSNYINTQK